MLPLSLLRTVLSESSSILYNDIRSVLSAAAFSGRDDMQLTVTGNADRMVLTARFDNLGKGASGAAIQNMNLLLGVDETTGLVI